MPPLKHDIVGQRFGRLRVVSFSHSTGRRTFWRCICDCGKEKIAQRDVLVGGLTQSCGCIRREDLTGQRFGRLIVVGFSHTESRGAFWKCECDCGNEKVALHYFLKSGGVQSCGCYRPAYKHGHAFGTKTNRETRTYRSWAGMIQRCVNSNIPVYKYYGARGITVCDRWRESFENFLEDMGERPKGTSIDRINVDGNYEPGNCRWATPRVQRMNQRRCYLSMVGREQNGNLE